MMLFNERWREVFLPSVKNTLVPDDLMEEDYDRLKDVAARAWEAGYDAGSEIPSLQ